MKKVLCVLVTVVMLSLVCIGCSSAERVTENPPEESTSSFVIVKDDLMYGYYYKIVYHKDTKVMYAVSQENAFEVMLNPDGSPMVWEGE